MTIIKASDHFKQIHSYRRTGLEIKGLETGFTALDTELKFRLALGRFMVITGIPGMGKSEFLDALNLNLALMHGWKTLYFSPENNPEDEHVIALIEKHIGKKISRCSEIEVNKTIEFIDTFFTWTRPKDKTLGNLLDIAKEQQAKNGLHHFIIDPWNYVTQKRTSMIHEHLSDQLNLITSFTREQQILQTVVAHPTNLPKDKDGNTMIPDLYSISDGAQWRNKMDLGLVVHRSDMSKDQIEIRLGKRRKKWMGNIGRVLMDYDKESGRFKSLFEKEFVLPNSIEVPF